MKVANRKSPLPVMIVLVAALVVCIGAAAMTISAAIRRAEASNKVEIVDLRSPIKTTDIETSPDSTGLPVLFDAPKFDLVNQDSQRTDNATLSGHPYVAAFIFTNCTGICPMMTGKMASLQEQIADRRVKLVSFTVDPERDTPGVLKVYSDKFSADSSRWFFLTGTKDQMVRVEGGFHVRLPNSMMKGATADLTTNSGPEHSDRFILVDQKGRVRGVYDSKDEEMMNRMKADSARLAELGR